MPNPTQDRSGMFSIFAALTAVAAFLLAAIGVGIALTNDDDGGGGGSTGDGAAAAGPITATLTEFAIDLSAPSVAGDSSITLNNAGTAPHNLVIEGTDLASDDVPSGSSATLALGGLAPGEYTVFCSIAGHRDSGMETTLTVTAGSGGGESAGGTTTTMAGMDHGGDGVDYAALDAATEESVNRFLDVWDLAEGPLEPAPRGNEVLEGTPGADGVLEYELTAEIVDWETEPGRVVKAWTYNGMVPAPWIKMPVDTPVRVTVTNNLPMGTDVHWHGIVTPNDQDGVAAITQPLIEAGDTYTYEFTTGSRYELGMYHPHHHGNIGVVNGMFGVLQIGEATVPSGTFGGLEVPADVEFTEFPMVLNDAGVIGLSLNGHGFPQTEPLVMKQGDWVLIHYFNEGLVVHPMHTHGFPGLVVARDGIPLDSPYWADVLNIAPGERYSVLLNASRPGVWAWHCHILNHAESEKGLIGMTTVIKVDPPA